MRAEFSNYCRGAISAAAGRAGVEFACNTARMSELIIAETRAWVVKGCTTAGIGCLECKQPVIDAVIREQQPFHERAQRYLDDETLVRNIVADGCERARKLAEETMRDVREAMGLAYD